MGMMLVRRSMSIALLCASLLVTLAGMESRAIAQTPAPGGAAVGSDAACTITPEDFPNPHVIVVNVADEKKKWRVLTLSKARTRGQLTVNDLFKYLAEPHSGQQKLDEASRYAPMSEARLISAKHDDVAVFVIFREGQTADERPKVAYKETKRESRISKDVATLADLFLSGALPLTKQAGEVRVYCEMHQLDEARGTLAISATPPMNSKGPKAPTGLDAVAASISLVADSLKKPEASGQSTAPGQANASTSASILTGSREHWFLSANVNVRKFSELSFDQKSNQIVPKEKAPPFLIAANYFIGDLASSGANNVFVGIAIEPKTSASSAVGPIMGLRFSSLGFLGLSFDLFSPYVGYLRIVNSEAVEGAERVRWRVVTGLSLNLDKVADFVKK